MSSAVPCRIVLAEHPTEVRRLARYLRSQGVLAVETVDPVLGAAAGRATGRSEHLLEVLTPRVELARFLTRLAEALPELPVTWVFVAAETAALLLVRTGEPSSAAWPFLDFFEVAQLLRQCGPPILDLIAADTPGRSRARPKDDRLRVESKLGRGWVGADGPSRLPLLGQEWL